jgi:hypothetical protein
MKALDLEPLFAMVDKAIAEHPKLRRAGDPQFVIDRLGVTVKIRVSLVGSRKRPHDISGDGETTEEAVEKLISTLDLWAQAIA